MRISLNWLRDYLDIRPETELDHITDSLTLAGIEVEAVTNLKNLSKEVALGTITKVEPASHRVSICHLDYQGRKVTVQVEENHGLVPGMSLAFKRSGDADDKKADHYHAASYGDLGFPIAQQDMICLRPDDVDGGVPDSLDQIPEFDDVILTLGITPNRADALAHLGISRELSALLDLPLKAPMLSPKEMGGMIHERVVVEIDRPDDCPRYACRLLENIVIKESPLWLRLRLLKVGIRPINNVVDVTNYVMISRNQPMHAFDFDKIEQENGRAKIIVRRADSSESMMALNGQMLELKNDDVVIADPSKILALAGVIGGLTSSIEASTTTVLLESAFFDAKNVRAASKHHGIGTESSYRFERGTDINGVIDALNFASRLLTDMSGAKVCRDAVDVYRKRAEPLEVKMRPERAQAILGIDSDKFDQDLLRKRFLRLGIETVAKRGDAIYFRVPTHRPDITREIDLIEEAVRMLGYDLITERVSSKVSEAKLFGGNRSLWVLKKLRDVFVARGFSQAINYSFVSAEYQKPFITEVIDANLIHIKNPLSERYGAMRASLLPGLIKNLTHNQRNQEKSISLFEYGTVFLGENKKGAQPNPEVLSGFLDQDSFCVEKQMLAGVMWGNWGFRAFDQAVKKVDFYHLKGVLEEALLSLGLRSEIPHQSIWFERGTNSSYLHPGESCTISYATSDREASPIVIGTFGKLNPSLSSKLEINGDAFVFELSLAEIESVAVILPRFNGFSRYPQVERDVAFLVEEEVDVGEILKNAQTVSGASNILTAINVFDIYRGKNLGPNKKSVAISLTLRNDERTLTDEEVESFVNEYIEEVLKRTKGKIR